MKERSEQVSIEKVHEATLLSLGTPPSSNFHMYKHLEAIGSFMEIFIA